MKKLCALVAHLIVFSALASAQTNVSGFINANTTWTLAGSPYIVTGNALLSQGFTLTIDPGVVVKFDNNNALQIDGQLIAIGTVNQRIIFTSNQASPQPGDWAKLHFSDFCVDAVYDAAGNYLSGTIMKYCDVLYAGSLMWGSIDIQESSPYLTHCRIKNGSWCGINFNGDHFRIDSSAIRDCAKRGIYYQGGHFLMRNDTFIGNAEGAVHILQSYDGVQSRIEDCHFRFNYGAITWQNSGLHHITITQNSFMHNNGPAVISLQGQYDTVSCNRFMYNTNGPAIHWGDGGNPFSGGVIYNNIIEYNTNNSGPSVFWIGAGQYLSAADTLFISNNTIRHNASPGNTCCQMEVTLTGNTRTLQIYDNLFTENSGNSFMRFFGPQTGNPAFDFMYMNGNTFINPLCQYELYNSILYGSPNLQVAGNYWGNNSTSYVDGVIYDYFDFANQSVVYYNPILTGPTVLDTTCQPFQLPMAVDEHAIENQPLEIYPNPTSGNFSINFTDEQASGAILEILNPLSQVISTVTLNNRTANSFTLPEECGVYIIRVTTEEKIWVGKIIKE
jgi:hypothetical protein